VILLRRLVSIGTSVGITLPRELLRERGFKRGDTFLLDLVDGAIILRHVPEADIVQAMRAAAADADARRRSA